MPEYTSIDKLYQLFCACNQSICTDTRKPVPGSIFFCLRGENFNANEFAAKAIGLGCRYAVVDDEKFLGLPEVLFVESVLKTLQKLAHHHRQQFSIPVLAITGSNGKTTNKELIHAVLEKKYNTLATSGNLNNHIGVPLTLLRLRKEHEFLIVEMGANHQGEIAELCQIANPDYGLITNIGKAHLEGFGGVEGVIKGKSEMYVFLRKKNAMVFVNGDDKLLCSLSDGMRRILYGTGPQNLVTGREIENGDTLSFTFTINKAPQQSEETPVLKTRLVGSYNLHNFLAAACIGHYFNVEQKAICAALEWYTPNMNRSQMVKTGKNKLILDAYNANPNSMRAAIENFAKLPDTNKLLLLGDMYELGEESEAEHKMIVELIRSSNIKQAILVGERFSNLNVDPYLSFKTTNDCKQHLAASDIRNFTVLIKGSRSMRMEVLQEVL